MTTTITDIAGLVRILNEQPEWRDTIRAILLGRELLELPQQFAEFVRVTEENNRLVAERLDRLEDHVAGMKGDMIGLKADMADMKEWRGETTLRLDRIEGRLGNLEGAELERRVHSDIANIAARRLDLNRVRVIKSRIVLLSTEFLDAIEDAVEQGLITDDQGYRLGMTDIIISARRRSDRQDVHAAIEVSRSIADRDITRASERGQSLSAILGTPAISAVIGGNIGPPQQELADSLNVSTIILPRLAV